jgi:hypothetical protein
MMEDKEKFEALIKLADIQQKGFDKRRDIEWKVSLALWAAIFIGTGFLLDHKELKYDICEICLGYFIFFIIYVIWVGKMGDSHEKDKFYRNEHRKLALHYISGRKLISIKNEDGSDKIENGKVIYKTDDEELKDHYDLNQLYEDKYEVYYIKDKEGKIIKRHTKDKFITEKGLKGYKIYGLFYDLWLACEIAITSLFLLVSFSLLFSNHPYHFFYHCSYH